MNKRVLIIDDDPDLRALLEFILKREGFDVEHAVDGEEAIKKIDSGTTPDLVLLDVMMPYHDGFEILENMRLKQVWNDIPVFILTARDEEEKIDRAFKLGVTDYLSKPFKPKELVARINQILN